MKLYDYLGREMNVTSEGVAIKPLSLYNIERKAKQLSEVEYDTLLPIPSPGGGTPIPSGHKIGCIYSDVYETDKYIGVDVSLKTFLTAINNPYSLEYTEDVYNHISDYGFVYNSSRDSNIGGYYGVVCNSFVEFATGMEVLYPTFSFEYLERIGVLSVVDEQSAQGAELGMYIWQVGHVATITKIIRDSDGNVTNIEVREGRKPTAGITNYTASSFNAYLRSINGILYRYNDLYKNDKYCPSEFVAVDNEWILPYKYNDDICTFAGDYACFRQGQIIFINYNLKEVKEWSTIEVYKGDTLVHSGSIDASIHRYDLTSLNLTYGKYKARLKNGSAYSDYTYFEILQTDASYAPYSGDTKKITFSKDFGTPICYTICKITGSSTARVILTQKEIAQGYVLHDILAKSREQRNAFVSGQMYIKVHYQGEYGRVTSEYIKITDL